MTKIPEPTVNIKPAVMKELPNWIARVNEMRKDYYEQQNITSQFRPVTVGKGRKYLKILSGSSIYCFVRVADGAILKAATWAAPALNHIRGYIFEKDVTKAVDIYGAVYMENNWGEVKNPHR